MYEIVKINGFCVILNRIKKSKTCRVTAYIGDGNMNETKETSGIAHLIEHILTESWKKCFKKGCSAFWKNYGVITNAETEDNLVSYWIEGLAEYRITMIEYMVSIITNPIITQKRLEKEKKAVKHELRRINKQETDLLNRCNKMLYTNIGLQNYDNSKLQIKNLSKFTLNNVLDWHKQFYCQNNTIFAIVGDFKRNEVIEKLKYLLNKSTYTLRCAYKNYNFFKKGIVVDYVKNIRKENTTIVFSFPQHIVYPNKMSIYIRFFSLFIGSGVESFIMQELREKRGLIYSTVVTNNIYPRTNVLTIELSTSNIYIKKVICETINILLRIIKGEFLQETMNDIKKKFMVNHYRRCLSNAFYTKFYGSQLMNQLETLDGKTKLYTYEEVANLITNINKAEFISFVKRIINFNDLKLIYQGSQKISIRRNEINKMINNRLN